MTRRPLIFDIETIGDITTDNRDEIATLAAGREVTPEAYAALCPPLARVVCIAWLDADAQQLAAVFDATLLPGAAPGTLELDDGTGTSRAVTCALHSAASEAALLDTFGTTIEQHLAQPNGQLVTYNGRGFDLPVLIHRSIKHGVTHGRGLLIKAMNENRFRPSLHADLMDVVTFGGAGNRWPMSTYAVGYGYRSPKTAMSGADVCPAVQAGQIIEVVRYCAGDVLATGHLHSRVACLLQPPD